MSTIKLTRKKDFDDSGLDTGSVALGFNEIELLFNIGPHPAGGDCLIVKADGDLTEINSDDLFHDLEAYAKEIQL